MVDTAPSQGVRGRLEILREPLDGRNIRNIAVFLQLHCRPPLLILHLTAEVLRIQVVGNAAPAHEIHFLRIIAPHPQPTGPDFQVKLNRRPHWFLVVRYRLPGVNWNVSDMSPRPMTFGGNPGGCYELDDWMVRAIELGLFGL